MNKKKPKRNAHNQKDVIEISEFNYEKTRLPLNLRPIEDCASYIYESPEYAKERERESL